MNDFKPIQIAQNAQYEILATQSANKIPEEYGLRVGVKGGACSSQFMLGFDIPTSNDQIYWIDGIKVLIDKRHLMYVIGTEIGFEENDHGAGFTVYKLHS